ncbi:MAG: RagB/SusD family nutrient uptake outer membrane protein [Gemmatimonadaceae bacterium]
MRRLMMTALLASSLGLVACDLDTTNPNAPTQETVVTSAEGMLALGVGLQARFGTSTGTLIYSAGLLTEELGAIGTAFSTISDAERGAVPPGAGMTIDVWNSHYRTIKTANDIIVGAPNVVLPRGTRSGLLGLASLFKAAAIGELLQAYDSLAIDTYNTPTPDFVGRETALDAVLALLDSAQLAYADTAPSGQFTSQVLVSGLDIPNTISAYKARYRRLEGDWAGALAAADSVSRTVFSRIPFSAQAPNPLFNLSTGSSGVLPRDAYRADPLEAQRTAFFVRDTAILGRIDTPLDAWVVFAANTSPIPTYYPDEVLLIKAEALVNLNRLPEAQAVVDSVRTDCPGAGRVTTDPGPCRAPLVGVLTAEQLLAEIYRNRRYELFATGLRWEDLRRLGQIGATEVGKRCWLPYPVVERNANPGNVPPDREGTEPPTNNAACVHLEVVP